MAGDEKPRAPRWTLWLPLALFGLFVVLVVVGLVRPKDTTIESHMIGKPLPVFALRAAADGRPGVATTDLATGKPQLLNIFASWCIPCRAEAPVLGELAAKGVVINGIAIRDRREDLATFLKDLGNPYQRIGADDVSSVQLAIGSAGVPETFVIDGKGVIRYQHIGDIRPDQIPLILQKLKEAEQ
ncbi:DsbE family thiol:disulfide interchange protein [Novosphingobium sp. FSY-8]|uniref:DsbE family thiol:disulfide interchange protein n=1 Tax=Novosphingobium ovatum TaxID=1908523 RepID=A0ABW9XD39_9SPHN|nr:DsbE family thiol:disulfide interchange protein [Novosphingobium ovatum]NBC36407.1 DsbE family thiol:disulfide interchange protein [Novosphingobium ovatum]